MVAALFWISFGALVGWIIAIMEGNQQTRRTLVFVLTGVIGGLCGGLCGLLTAVDGTDYADQSNGITFALTGAAILVTLARIASKKLSSRS